MESLDELFEAEAAKRRAEAIKEENDPVRQAALKARREADLQRDIANGVRDADGNYLLPDEPEDDEDEEDPEDETD